MRHHRSYMRLFTHDAVSNKEYEEYSLTNRISSHSFHNSSFVKLGRVGRPYIRIDVVTKKILSKEKERESRSETLMDARRLGMKWNENEKEISYE